MIRCAGPGLDTPPPLCDVPASQCLPSPKQVLLPLQLNGGLKCGGGNASA